MRGDATNAEDLERAGIDDAAAALVFPVDPSDEADMHSILAVMAIESVAPGVRTVAEVNNPRHEPHFRRADVDELLVTSKVASHLLARSALYPGLTAIVTDIVSGGEGSELYRIAVPDDYVGLTIDEVGGPAAPGPPGDAAVGQPRRPRVREPGVRLPSSRSATTRSSSPSRWARWRRSRCATRRPRRSRPRRVPSA